MSSVSTMACCTDLPCPRTATSGRSGVDCLTGDALSTSSASESDESEDSAEESEEDSDAASGSSSAMVAMGSVDRTWSVSLVKLNINHVGCSHDLEYDSSATGGSTKGDCEPLC